MYVRQVDFPYLVLLVSGGHSLLAIVENVDKFYLLGSTTDNAPGEVLDKVYTHIEISFCHLFVAHSRSSIPLRWHIHMYNNIDYK